MITTAIVRRDGDDPFEFVFTMSSDCTYWNCTGFENGIIFDHLAIPKHAYCSEFYTTERGIWPAVNMDVHPDEKDRYERLVNAMCHFKEYGCTVEINDEAKGVLEAKPVELIDKFFDL